MHKFRIEAVIEGRDDRGDGNDLWYRFAVELEATDKQEAEIIFNLLYPNASISVDDGITERR